MTISNDTPRASADFLEYFLSQVPRDSRYRYEVLSEQHIDRTIKMFTHSFCDFEPMTHYVGMEYEAFTPFATAVVEKAAKDGLSVVALDGERVVACALVEDAADPVAFSFELDPKFKYIFTLLEALSGNFFVGKQFDKNHVAHLFITAVDGSYRGQGLSKQVNFRAMARAAQNNFSFMFSELTHYYNEKGTINHLQNKKLPLGSFIYMDYEHEGVRPFEHLAGSASSYIWELKEGAKLTYHHEDHVFHESFGPPEP